MKYCKLFFCFYTIFFVSLSLMAQNYQSDGSVVVDATERVFEFTNASFKYSDLLSLDADLSGGIIGTVNSGGYIVLEVYNNNKSQLLYKKKLTTTSTTFAGGTENITWQGKPIVTDQIKYLASNISFPTKEPLLCEMSDPTLFRASLYAYGANYRFANPYAQCLKNNFSENNPVYVKVTAKSATIKRIKYPGQTQELVMGDLNPSSKFTVSVYINGISQGAVTTGTIPTFNAKVGDDIKFVFSNTSPTFKRIPVFSGIPAVWRGHFAGETKFFCTPSIQPNDIKPWLGFDSQVHGSLLRRYPQRYKERFPDFEKNSSGEYISWSFTLQREMDPTKTNYVPEYTWSKEKRRPVRQRNNQKEGLNMELLQMNNDVSFESYNGLPYLLGSDPDEIYYMNGKDPNTFMKPPTYGLLLKTDEVWKRVPYGESDEPANDMVTAYLRNRYAKVGEKHKIDITYTAYEIQDKGTSPFFPDGTGVGNNKAPGVCTITLGNSVVIFKLNVTTPLSNTKGFYANIEGTIWPGWDENEPYTLRGLAGKTSAELKSYVLVYTNENSIGNVNTQLFKFSSLTDAQLTAITVAGSYTTKLQMRGNGYNNITLYKYNQNKNDSTIIAGKELMSIVLRFITVPAGVQGLTLNEISDGGYVYLEEFRDNRAGNPLYMPLYGRYVKKFVRDYVIQKGTKLTFLTLDSDPYTFESDTTSIEWYLSTRYQAKRLQHTGTESQQSFVKYYLDPLNADGSVRSLSSTPEGSGSQFTKTYNTEGDYQLRVEYRNSNIKCYHRIKVVNYTNNAIGKIVVREMTAREKQLLNFDNPLYVMVEVTDVLARHKYVDGYRGQNPVNRFGRYNDYYANYRWVDQFTLTARENPQSIKNFISSYSESWNPEVWVRHFSDKPYPSDINPNLFKKPEDVASFIGTLYINAPEPWQVRLPWAPITTTEGARYRTNIKAIYNMNRYFDNDNGAFSGDPKAITSDMVFNKFITDDQLDKKELFYDLLFGRKIILTKRETNLMRVENAANEAGKPGIFIAYISNIQKSPIAPKPPLSENNIVDNNNIPIMHRSPIVPSDTNILITHKTPITPSDIEPPLSENNEVVLYPVPTQNILNIRMPKIGITRLEGYIYNTAGQLLMHKYWLIGRADEKITINVNKLQGGNYILYLSAPEIHWKYQGGFLVTE